MALGQNEDLGDPRFKSILFSINHPIIGLPHFDHPSVILGPTRVWVTYCLQLKQASQFCPRCPERSGNEICMSRTWQKTVGVQLWIAAFTSYVWTYPNFNPNWPFNVEYIYICTHIHTYIYICIYMWTESTSWGLQLLLFVAPNRQLSGRTWKPSFTIFYPVVTTTIESLIAGWLPVACSNSVWTVCLRPHFPKT